MASNVSNKKVSHATCVSYGQYHFRSKAELKAFLLLEEAGLNPKYEELSITLMDHFRPKEWFHQGKMTEKMQLSITYKPDFTVQGKSGTIYLFEIKGFETDQYKLRRKLVLNYITTTKSPEYVLFEVRSAKDISECIEYIKKREK